MVQKTNLTKVTDWATFADYPVTTSPTQQNATWTAGSNGTSTVDLWGDVLTGVGAATKVTVASTGAPSAVLGSTQSHLVSQVSDAENGSVDPGVD